jgi:hypothetical protein
MMNEGYALPLGQLFTLSPRRPGGEGGVRGADKTVCGATHLTLPLLRNGPLPLLSEGRRGAWWGV